MKSTRIMIANIPNKMNTIFLLWSQGSLASGGTGSVCYHYLLPTATRIHFLLERLDPAQKDRIHLVWNILLSLFLWISF